MSLEGTPSLKRFINTLADERERQQEIIFPAKVLNWDSATNVVKLEPQFFTVWRDGTERRVEEFEDGDQFIDNVPVMFPRSGQWRITFPIEEGSFGAVLCTKYSLEVWRSGAGDATDPGDLRTYTLNGATFHPVNLYPERSSISGVPTDTMVLGTDGTAQFVALANLVKAELDAIETTFSSIVFTVDTSGGTGTPGTIGTPYTASDVASATVKATE